MTIVLKMTTDGAVRAEGERISQYIMHQLSKLMALRKPAASCHTNMHDMILSKSVMSVKSEVITYPGGESLPGDFYRISILFQTAALAFSKTSGKNRYEIL